MSWFSRRRGTPEPEISAHRPAHLLDGRYQLGPRLGEGSQSDVREAVDLRTGGTVAVKLLHLPENLPARERQEWAMRLRREVELARKLAHSDIIEVHESGIDGNLAWMAMERVRGVDLGRYARPDMLLPENLVLRIGARVAGALAHAHANGVVHRDLKPANVLVNLGSGQVKLADFGVARDESHALTRTGLSLGTPAYMAPEMLAGAPASPASDAYALGVMLFELLSGRRPHEADTLGALLKATASQPPASLAALRPGLPVPVVAAVHELLAPAPGDRPGDLGAWATKVAALAALLTRLLAPSSSNAL